MSFYLDFALFLLNTSKGTNLVKLSLSRNVEKPDFINKILWKIGIFCELLTIYTFYICVSDKKMVI